MTPIRPQLPQTVAQPKPAADARSAFFHAVREPGAVPPAAAAQPRPQPPALATTRVQAQPEPPTLTRHLRPGSLLDIKV